MIGLLKRGKINNRLLCEMAAYRDFARLLAEKPTPEEFRVMIRVLGKSKFLKIPRKRRRRKKRQ